MNNTLFDKPYYEQLCVDVLEKARRSGATTAEVTISIEAGFSVASRLGQIETVEHNQDKGIGITVFIGQKTGSASSSDLSLRAIEMAVDKACSIAKFTSSDPCAGLAEKSQIAFDYPDLDLDYPWSITTEEALNLAMECENLAMNDPRVANSEGASVNSHRALQVYGNSHNFIGSYLSTQHSINCVLIAQEDGKMHRDYDYSVVRNPQKLKDINLLAKSVRDKTLMRLGARRIKTQSSPVIFSPEIARGLLSHLVSAISGGHIYRQSSFLVDCLSKQILPNHVNLIQYPHLPTAIGSMPFDNEGVLTSQQNFVKHGVLEKYILSSYSGRKLGMPSTGNAGGVFNLLISANSLPFADLLKELNTGLLVTELIGQGVNIVNGDYSRGAFGYWVENGEIVYPVEEITIAGNLRDMLMNIVAVSDDIDARARIHTGAILIEKMMIAGI